MIIIYIICTTFRVDSQQIYYMHNNEKVNFNLDHNYFTVWCTFDIRNELDKVLEGDFKFIRNFTFNPTNDINPLNDIKIEQYYVFQYKSISDIDIFKAQKIEKTINNLGAVSYSAYASSNEHKIDRFFSNQILVMLRENSDIDILKEEAAKFNAKVLGVNKFLPLMYHIICDKNSLGKSNEIANRLYSTSLFNFAEPDILGNFKAHCVNDPSFGDQWFLKNIGQSGGTTGVDIKACNAWQTTMGNSNIITAVVDEGVEVAHPDLNGSFIGSWDIVNGSSPSVVRGPHGTSCAGLIAARGNNNLGVTGVAPNTSMYDLSFDYSTTLNSQISTGINHAANQNVSIFSCSWGGGGASGALNATITNLLANGRNGLGCVFIFSAGNNNVNGAEYPSNSNPEIICVGAIDRCGVRSGLSSIISGGCDPWPSGSSPASSYGDPLDIVAGGTNTYSTDRTGTDGYDTNSDYFNFGGTSAACPIVAGVAALILSVNPCLSQKAVHDIICKSGQKLNSYTFTTSSLRPSELGLWNNEVGHGHVNAEACVRMAETMYLQFKSESSNKNYLYRKIEAGKNVDPYTAVGDYNILSTGNVTLRANESITFKDGFHATYGSTLSARIETNAPCSHSNPILKLAKMNDQINQNLSSDNQNISIISAYPNPTNDIVNINYELIEDSKISISIFDLQGKQVFLDNFNRKVGTYKEEIAGFRNLQNSIYILKVCLGSNCQSFRIIKDEVK